METLDKHKEDNTGIEPEEPSGRKDSGERKGRDVGEDTGKPPNSSSSMMLGLLDEFTKIYSDRLQRIEDTSMKSEGKQYLENKVSVLESWVRDLGEQNAVLVATVEELEREAADRVALLEDRLSKMAATTRQSCVSLRDHQIQVSSLVTDKIGLEKETKLLVEKIHTLETKNSSLLEENSGLHSDINNLIQVIARARGTGQWESDDLTFSYVTPEQVFGPVLSSSRMSSPSSKEYQHDCFQQLMEDPLKKDNSSVTSSFSNLQDMESSTCGGNFSDKALLIMKLRSDLQSIQSLHEDASIQLLERDKQIADLQSQLTEMQQKMAMSRPEAGIMNLTLQELRYQKRPESTEFQVSRREEVIRHILSKKSLKCEPDSVIAGRDPMETQLSENIDVLVSRLAELEEECEQLREQHKNLQESHDLCAPTINMLKEQLNKSHETQVELRTVLTAEVAQRHDQLIALHDEHKEHEQKHHETLMQLQLKNEIIKELRKEIRELKENQNDLTPIKESSYSWENKCAETQTDEVYTIRNGVSLEDLSKTSSGCYSSSSQFSQISKLENELTEKSILLRELQSHLAASRQELHLKDETLYKLEQKLDSSRRAGGEKGERMQYLTGQLTSLQLEVARTHGQVEQLRRQVESKTELVHKLETENSSLIHQLNDKSSTVERFQNELLKIKSELDNKKKEGSEQRLTISALQDALVSSKRSCDELRSRLNSDKEKVNKEREQLTQQLQESERQRKDMATSLQLLQGQVQSLEEDVASSTERRAAAERKADEAWRKSLHLQERLSAQETSESVERLGQQLEEMVAALTIAREEARAKTERLRRAQLDVEQLTNALGYEKDLNISLHDQVEALVKEVAAHEDKVEGLRKEVRRQTRNASQMEKKFSSSETQVEELGQQVEALKGQLQEEQREVSALQDSLTQETKLLKETQNKLDQTKKEAAHGEEKSMKLKKDLQEARERIHDLEHQILKMKGEQEAEVAVVAEHLTAAHEESVRRLEESLMAYTRIQDHDHFQVKGLEESLAEVGSRLAEAEMQMKNIQQERDALERSLRQERRGREEDAKEHQHQIFRLAEENSLLKARLESVQEETAVWQRQCEDLEQRQSLTDATTATPTTNTCLLTQLARAQHQVEELREALREARQEKRAAEEERSHAHEQVLSLIRECNALEEQIHRLTKDKCRLEEQVSGREADLIMAKDSTNAIKEELILKTEQISHLENEICKLKRGHEADAGDAMRHEANEMQRLLLEKDSQAKVTQLKLTALQRSLQDKQSELLGLEEKLHEAQAEISRRETEAAQLKTQVATITTQLSNAFQPPTTEKVKALEDQVSHMNSELADKEKQLKQAKERDMQQARKTEKIQQEVPGLIKSRDDALRQVMLLETTLTETREAMEASQTMGRLWEVQLANIEKEVARLLCETSQLKDCNAALHDQLSSSQSENSALQDQIRARETQVEELQQARNLLASDAQVVVAAVRQWLHEQKVANTKLAGKLHQQNKQILLLNTEKQFLAERNTGLQRMNHDLTLQVHDLRTRLGLPLTTNTHEKLGKVGGVMSPRVMSPTLGVASAGLPGNTTSLSTPQQMLPEFEIKFGDIMSSCSSEGSVGSSHVPVPDLPCAAQLDRLSQLADSLLAASRNISHVSGLIRCQGAGKLTCASSLGDLTTVGALDHLRPLGNSKKTSASVGNLTAISPLELKDKVSHSTPKPGSRVSPGSWPARGGEVIMAAPVRERKGSHRIFTSHSIEEADEEDVGTQNETEGKPCVSQSTSLTTQNVQNTLQSSPKISNINDDQNVFKSCQVWSISKTTQTNSKTTTASQTPKSSQSASENDRKPSRSTSA